MMLPIASRHSRHNSVSQRDDLEATSTEMHKGHQPARKCKKVQDRSAPGSFPDLVMAAVREPLLSEFEGRSTNLASRRSRSRAKQGVGGWKWKVASYHARMGHPPARPELCRVSASGSDQMESVCVAQSWGQGWGPETLAVRLHLARSVRLARRLARRTPRPAKLAARQCLPSVPGAAP